MFAPSWLGVVGWVRRPPLTFFVGQRLLNHLRENAPNSTELTICSQKLQDPFAQTQFETRVMRWIAGGINYRLPGHRKIRPGSEYKCGVLRQKLPSPLDAQIPGYCSPSISNIHRRPRGTIGRYDD